MAIFPGKNLPAIWTLRGFFALHMFILILLAWTIFFPWLSTTLQTLAMESLRHEGWEVRQTVATFIDHRSQILQDFAHLPQIRNALTGTAESEKTLREFLGNLSFVGVPCQMILLDHQGQYIHASRDYPLFDYRQEPWFSQLILGQQQNYIGISTDQGNSFWQFAILVKTTGAESGILVAELPVRFLSKERHLFNGLEDGQLNIFFNDRMIASFGQSFSKNTFSYQLESPAITLTLHSDRFNLEKPVRNLLLVFVSSLVALILIMLVIAHYFNRAHFVKPIEQLRSHTQLLAQGKVSDPVPEEHQILELALLAEDFNAMAAQVAQREQELIESRNTLEQKVQERTAELNVNKSVLQNAYRNLEQLVEKRTRKLKQIQDQMMNHEKTASIDQLAAGVADELNNPLNIVCSNFSTLQQNIGDLKILLTDYRKSIEQFKLSPDDQDCRRKLKEREEELHLDVQLAEIEQLFRDTDQGFERLSWIVQSMQNFPSLDQAGKLIEYDLNQGVQEALVLARNEYKFHAEIKTDLQPLPPLFCNPQQINQVFLNLILNAAQAIAGQGHDEPGHIRIRSWVEEGTICISFTDSGPGIPEGIRDRIFEPFFSTKDAESRTGLGLAVCQDIIVHKHGGTLTLSSGEPGETCFTIRLPTKRIALPT